MLPFFYAFIVKIKKGETLMNEKIIEIKNLTKSYGKHRGVEKVSFEVARGDIFGFLGPNGAGKSTTIRSMLGFLDYEGEINILGKDTKAQKELILQDIGYMPSEAMFYPNMRVRDVIKFAADVRKRDCDDEANKLCERLKVDVNKRINELSLGNRKKVSIVCAMQHKPKLFIFDEPTSGLDPLMQNIFFELINEYVKTGTTCFLSTHVLPEVKRYCKHVAIMKEGHLISQGSVAELTNTSSKRVVATVNGESVDYLFTGDINTLLGELSEKNVEDLNISDPSIDEIFMSFYSDK